MMARKRRPKNCKPVAESEMLTLLSPPSPIYAADWRWQRALLNSPKPNDEWSARLAGCGSELANLPADAGQWLATRDPIVAAAHEIFVGDEFRRAELEARVLANQPRAELAEKMGIDEDVVEAYEAIFFDVRSRLQRPVWVQHCLLKLHPLFVFQTHDTLPMWRLFGWRHGAVIVDLLTSRVGREQLVRHGIDAYLEPEVDLPAILKRRIACERLPYPRTAAEMLQFLRLLQLLHEVQRFERDVSIDLAAPLSEIRCSSPAYPKDDAVLVAIREVLKAAA